MLLPLADLLVAALQIPASTTGRAQPGAVPSATSHRLVAEAKTENVSDGSTLGPIEAFVLVTLHGRPATLAVRLGNPYTLILVPTGLKRAGIVLSDTTRLDSLTLGMDVLRDVPLTVRELSKDAVDIPWDKTQPVLQPPHLPPVIGILGGGYLRGRYDIVYESEKRIQLYAPPSRPTRAHRRWVPPGFSATACARMVPIPIRVGVFTAWELRAEGHPVTAALEMIPIRTQITTPAQEAIGLTIESPRFKPSDRPNDPHGPYLHDLQLSVGSYTFPKHPASFDGSRAVQSSFPPGTPVILMGLSSIEGTRIFHSVSSNRVCFAPM